MELPNLVSLFHNTCLRRCTTSHTSSVLFFTGAGIHIFSGTSDPSFPNAYISVANNALVIALAGPDDSGSLLRIICRSDAMMESSSRQIIGLNGNSIETAGAFTIERNLPGEIAVFNIPPSPAVTASDQGVYTCRIQLQSGEIRDINIGIYPTGFSSEFCICVHMYK